MRKKIIDHINVKYSKFLEVLYAKSKRFRNSNSRVLISGMPRGGTTWFAEMLITIEGSTLLWEPLRRFRLSEIGKEQLNLELGWNPYLPEDAQWKEGETFLYNTFSCELLNYKSILRYNGFKSTFKSRYMVIKCVTANQLLPWINSNIDLKTIHLVRHPCAVIASMLRYGNFKYFHLELERYKEIKYNEIYYDYEDSIKALDSPVEKMAAIWCLNHIIPFKKANYEKRLTVYYEDLVMNPESEMEKVFQFIGKQIPSGISKKYTKPSFTTVDDAAIKTGGNQLNGWKNKLSDEQIAAIISVVKSFGIDLYNDSALPNRNSKFYFN